MRRTVRPGKGGKKQRFGGSTRQREREREKKYFVGGGGEGMDSSISGLAKLCSHSIGVFVSATYNLFKVYTMDYT